MMMYFIGTDSHDRELELHQMFAADDPYLDVRPII
jgi:hypothetical protein